MSIRDILDIHTTYQILTKLFLQSETRKTVSVFSDIFFYSYVRSFVFIQRTVK